MLKRPTWITNPCVLSIDPGSTMLGVSVIDYNLSSKLCYLLDAFTLDASRVRSHDQVLLTHGECYTRMHWMCQEIANILPSYGITEVYCESPYLRKFPTAFAVLTECVNMVRTKVMEYNQSVPFVTIDPATVKNSIGVGGKDPDKSKMMEGICKIQDILIPNAGFYGSLDQHAIDAIAVGYCGIKSKYG